MPYHHTKNTLEASYWCKVCNRHTMHRIDDGRLGPCNEHSPKEKIVKLKSEQKQLFEGQ